jgi:predicted oxidoreductase
VVDARSGIGRPPGWRRRDGCAAFFAQAVWRHGGGIGRAVERANMVERIAFAAGGATFSRLIYGTWRLLSEPTPPSAADLVSRFERCLALGITSLDTAEIYGHYGVEERLGAAFAQAPGLRRRMEIITKCGIYVPDARHPERSTAFYNLTAKRIVASVEKSLRLLQTDVIDLFLVHRPDWLTAADETARGLEEVVRTGKVRQVGVSNYNVHQLDLLESRLAIPVVTNQIEFGLFHREPLVDGTLDHCQRRRRIPMAWSPLGGGRLFAPDDEAAERVRQTMATLASKYADAGGEASPTELALAWIFAHPSRPVVVFGTNRTDRLPAIARASRLVLDRHDWYLLWSAAEGGPIP